MLKSPQKQTKPPGKPFTKGDPRINRDGPKRGLAALIREETGDGEELVRFALRVLRGDETITIGGEAFPPTLRDREWAADWLANRGFGKPPSAPEDLDAVREGGGSALSVLTRDELLAIAKGDTP